MNRVIRNTYSIHTIGKLISPGNTGLESQSMDNNRILVPYKLWEWERKSRKINGKVALFRVLWSLITPQKPNLLPEFEGHTLSVGSPKETWWWTALKTHNRKSAKAAHQGLYRTVIIAFTSCDIQHRMWITVSGLVHLSTGEGDKVRKIHFTH